VTPGGITDHLLSDYPNVHGSPALPVLPPFHRASAILLTRHLVDELICNEALPIKHQT
jgi:hypothetical protein